MWCCTYCRRRTAAAPLSARAATCIIGRTRLSAGWTACAIGPGSIFDLYERDGKLWLLQDSGIYALDKARILAGETPHATQYGTARGLTGSLRVNTCNYMAPDGSLYLTTRNGVSVFDFREISAPMPPLVINSIRVDDRTYESPEQLTPGA